YNEPAEKILGQRFEETFEMPMADWAVRFRPVNEDGQPVRDAELPLVIALNERKPAYSRFFIEGQDRVRRLIEVTAFPLTGRAGADERNLGAVALFWEATKS